VDAAAAADCTMDVQMFLCFLLKFKKTCFLCFFVVFQCRVFVVVKNKKVQNYKYDAFLMGKDSVSWTQRVFLAVLLTLFDSY